MVPLNVLDKHHQTTNKQLFQGCCKPVLSSNLTMQEPERKKTPVTVATVGPLPTVGQGLNGLNPHFLQKYDASDYILDKIDYEFYSSQRVGICTGSQSYCPK